MAKKPKPADPTPVASTAAPVGLPTIPDVLACEIIAAFKAARSAWAEMSTRKLGLKEAKEALDEALMYLVGLVGQAAGETDLPLFPKDGCPSPEAGSQDGEEAEETDETEELHP